MFSILLFKPRPIAERNPHTITVKKFSRIEDKSLFGYTDRYLDNALETEASLPHFEAMEQKHNVFGDIREVHSHCISDHWFNYIHNAAQQGEIDVLMVNDCDRLSADPHRCLPLINMLHACGVSIYSLHEGWINRSDSPDTPSKLQMLENHLISHPDTKLDGSFDRIIEENLEALKSLAE